jgi:hypothetical protein
MREYRATLDKDIRLGKQGESHARCVLFDVSEWQKVYGDGRVHLLFQGNGDPNPYPCTITVDGSHVCWVITKADVAYAGRGRVELQYLVGDTCVKSDIYTTTTMRSMGEAGAVPPEPQKGWVEQVLNAADVAEQSAQQAQEAVEHYPEVRNGTWWIWDAERGEFVDTGDPAQGEAGEQGEQGEQGPIGKPGPRGPSGVYLGSGDMPADCNVQIDPEGEPIGSVEDIVNAVLESLPVYNGEVEEV